MKVFKLYYILPALLFLVSCSNDSVEEVEEAITPEIESAEGPIVEVAYPNETTTTADVYYAGQKVPVEIYDDKYIYQGDILLPEYMVHTNNVKLVYEKGETPPANKSVGRTTARWTNNTIYYSIDPTLTNTQRVEDAMKHWEDNTNLRFVERTYQKNYVYFQPGSGCSSYVGMIGGRQNITLSPQCSTGSTIHEIGHAIGLWHEQSRVDRETYLTILYENIEAGKEHNFETYAQQNMDGAEFTNALDFGSIMMYDSYSFSKNGAPTIVKKDGTTYNTNRTSLSSQDIQGISAMYAPGASFEQVYKNGRYYELDGVLVYRMHDKWYFYSETGWREVRRVQEHWFFVD